MFRLGVRELSGLTLEEVSMAGIEGPRKVHRYSAEFKMKAVPASVLLGDGAYSVPSESAPASVRLRLSAAAVASRPGGRESSNLGLD